MTKFDSAEMPISKRIPFAAKAPIMISQDDARQGPMGHQILYVPGVRDCRCDLCERARLHLCRLVVRVRLKTRLYHFAARENGGALSSPLELMSIAGMNDIDTRSI
jgi:hypothetical protein